MNFWLSPLFSRPVPYAGRRVEIFPARVRYTALSVIEDVGRIVNPLTLHGQAIGSLVRGLGGAFLEHLVYDANGQFLAGNLAD